jgi:hypothetical protein
LPDVRSDWNVKRTQRTKAIIEIQTATPALAPNSHRPPNSAEEQNKMISRIEHRNSKQHKSQFQNSLAGACGVLLIILAGQVGVAQQGAPVKPAAGATTAAAQTPAAAAKPIAAMSSAPQANSEEKEASATGKPAGGGIKVHGHWVIDVKNPDGTTADHRDFQNSLVIGQGDGLLVGLLSGYLVPGDLAINLQGTACTSGGLSGCNIVAQNPSPAGQPGAFLCYIQDICSPSLTYNVVLAPNSGSTSIILSGTIYTVVTGTISTVGTAFNACDSVNGYVPGPSTFVAPTKPSTLAPASCIGAPTSISAIIALLTQTSNFTPLQVTNANQTIKVTVSITFA